MTTRHTAKIRETAAGFGRRGILCALAVPLAFAWFFAGSRAVAAPTAAVRPAKIRKTPAQIASEFVRLVDLDRAPWQFYSHYSAVFRQMAQRTMRVASKSKAEQARRQRVAKQFLSLSKMIAEMGMMAKLRRDIMDNTANIPPNERQRKFIEAGRRHDELLANFKKITGTVSVPGKKVSQVVKKTRRTRR